MQVEAGRLVNRQGAHAQMLLDARLDHSGWTPAALERLTDLAGRLPYEEATLLAGRFGLRTSSSELERLLGPYSKSCRETLRELLGQAEGAYIQADSKANGSAHGLIPRALPLVAVRRRPCA